MIVPPRGRYAAAREPWVFEGVRCEPPMHSLRAVKQRRMPGTKVRDKVSDGER